MLRTEIDIQKYLTCRSNCISTLAGPAFTVYKINLVMRDTVRGFSYTVTLVVSVFDRCSFRISVEIIVKYLWRELNKAECTVTKL